MNCNFLVTLVTLLAVKPQLLWSQSRHTNNMITVLMDFLREGEYWRNVENEDNKVRLLREYDFIVVGAGTAGCALAARLSENPEWKVLLLEAGGPELLVMDIPILAHFLQMSPDVNWGYRTEPSENYCLGLKDNHCKYPRGKVMGGSSVLNYMIYTRCNPRDYDHWAEMGNEGWSYGDVLPYFKKLEGSSVPDADSQYVGRRGPMKVSYPNWRSNIAKAFVKAVQEDGLPYRDYNGKRQVGVSFLQTTTNQQYRWSTNRAYLYPTKGKRPNLHVSKYSLVTKILIDPFTKTAYGVRFETKGHSYEVRARMEVISSAGAINTPQLLMLSGIGPAKHLRDMGIAPVADLAVGFNLQDHFAPGLSILTNETSLKVEQFFEVDSFLRFPRHKSIISLPGGVEAIAFYELENSENKSGWPDMELFMLCGGLDANPAIVSGIGIKDDIYQSIYRDILKDNLNVFMISPMMLQPRSRGRIMLRSKDPKQHPLIYPNYFHDPYDLDMAIQGLQKVIDLTRQPAMRRINARVLDHKIPACSKFGDVTSRSYLECYARHFTFTIYHQSGTAKMGPPWDRTAVVDARLNVYGIRNLRVVDASIMPKLVAGHPNGPVIMIAEKAADMIKQDYGYA